MSVEIEIKGLWQAMDEIYSWPMKMNKSAGMAAYRAITAGRKTLAVGIRGEYTIKSGKIKAATRVRKLPQEYGGRSMIISGPPLDMMEFSPKISKKGVLSVKVKKTRKALKSSFFVPANNGIYHRITKNRLPIRRTYTLSIPQMAGNVKVVDKVTERMIEVFEDRLAKALMYGGPDWRRT